MVQNFFFSMFISIMSQYYKLCTAVTVCCTFMLRNTVFGSNKIKLQIIVFRMLSALFPMHIFPPEKMSCVHHLKKKKKQTISEGMLFLTLGNIQVFTHRKMRYRNCCKFIQVLKFFKTELFLKEKDEMFKSYSEFLHF